MRRDRSTPLDPAVAVAGLLTRLGIFALIVLVPTLAIISRRAVATFVPLATVLLFMAAALDGRLVEALRRSLRNILTPTTLAFVALLAFAAISLVWTPQLGQAAERLVAVTLTLFLAVMTIAALPTQARPSDANLAPIGVLVATVLLAAGFIPNSPLSSLVAPGSPTEPQRAAMLLVLLIWPAAAALVARERIRAAWLLCAILAVTVWLVHDLVVITAFILAGLAFVLAQRWLVTTTRVFGLIALLALILTPGLGWLMSNYGGFLIPGEGDQTVAIWRDVTYAIPSHPILGFGFEASSALVRTVSNVPLGSPRNAALQLWLELGVVGVLLACIALVLGLRAIESASTVGGPAALAILVAAGTMMFAGITAWAVSWVTAICLAAIMAAFTARIRPRRRD